MLSPARLRQTALFRVLEHLSADRVVIAGVYLKLCAGTEACTTPESPETEVLNMLSDYTACHF